MAVDLLNIISFAVGIISLLYALYQQRQITQLRIYRIKNLRAALRSCTNVMSETYRLNKRKEEYGIQNSEAIAKIRDVHSNSTTLIRSFFEELSEIDKPWDEKQLQVYIDIGLITSEWMWEQAATFLEHKENVKRPTDLPKDTKDRIDYLIKHDVPNVE